MKMPAVINAFFMADPERGPDSLRPLFASHATVSDERTAHRGIDAITSWWAEARKKYRHTTEPLDAREQDGIHLVRGCVTGEFPGSPIILTYRFRLEDEKIAGLEIA